MDNIIFIDTETGGTNPEKHSLLSVGLVAWSKEKGIIASQELFIKNEVYSFTKKAKQINKFCQEQHDAKAVSHRIAVETIRSFCMNSTSKTKEIQIAGHNTHFDVSFLKSLFEEQHYSFSSLFSHRIIDTYSILKYLVDADILQLDTISSSSTFKHFKIQVKGRHSALGDAEATARLYEALLEVVKKPL